MTSYDTLSELDIYGQPVESIQIFLFNDRAAQKYSKAKCRNFLGLC